MMPQSAPASKRVAKDVQLISAAAGLDTAQADATTARKSPQLQRSVGLPHSRSLTAVWSSCHWVAVEQGHSALTFSRWFGPELTTLLGSLSPHGSVTVLCAIVDDHAGYAETMAALLCMPVTYVLPLGTDSKEDQHTLYVTCRYLEVAAKPRADSRGSHPDELPGRASTVADRMAQFAEPGGGAANGAAHDHHEHGHHDGNELPQVTSTYTDPEESL